ncbi:MAG: DUF1287 domain-containing protein [Caulobacterales bacterium]|nr:DUF1287 domain-containing protein [Caulobacterales bacterium]
MPIHRPTDRARRRPRRRRLGALAAAPALFLLSPAATADGLGEALAAAAVERTAARVIYDPSYQAIAYPMGDVAADRGVCADVVVRVFRSIGVDLQALVHEDMRAAFAAYPDHWGLTRPDPNIDHRRVLNLETFFAREGAGLPVSGDAGDYEPGDVVSWRLANGLPHIGMVSDQRSRDGARPLMVHNIGRGPRLEDVLFAYEIVGRYRWDAAEGG